MSVDWTIGDARKALEVSFASRSNITREALARAEGMQRLVAEAEADLDRNPVLSGFDDPDDSTKEVAAVLSGSLRPLSAERALSPTFSSTAVSREMRELVDEAQRITSASDRLLRKVMDSSGRHSRPTALTTDLAEMRSCVDNSLRVHELARNHVAEHVTGLQVVSRGTSAEVVAAQTVVHDLEEECAHLTKRCLKMQTELDAATKKAKWLTRVGHVRSRALARDPLLLGDETKVGSATSRLREIIARAAEEVKQKSNPLTVVQDRQVLQLSEEFAAELQGIQLAALAV